MLLIQVLWHNIRARADRVRDDETGALNTIELLILIGLVVALVGAIWLIIKPKIENKANSIQIS